jgi:hypothetical protein
MGPPDALAAALDTGPTRLRKLPKALVTWSGTALIPPRKPPGARPSGTRCGPRLATLGCGPYFVRAGPNARPLSVPPEVLVPRASPVDQPVSAACLPATVGATTRPEASGRASPFGWCWVGTPRSAVAREVRLRERSEESAARGAQRDAERLANRRGRPALLCTGRGWGGLRQWRCGAVQPRYGSSLIGGNHSAERRARLGRAEAVPMLCGAV